jgi:hypothetical protein
MNPNAYCGFETAEQVKQSRVAGVQEFRMQISVAGIDSGVESTASQAESFAAWRPIRTSYSETPATPELLTS